MNYLKLTSAREDILILCLYDRGSLFSNMFFKGVVLTSATFATAIYNLIPAMTFVVAVLLRYPLLIITIIIMIID